MEENAFNVSLDKNPKISIRVLPGHFATVSSHTNYYLDVSELKSNSSVAREVARELALPYLSSTQVDTIVCMEHTGMIGAYMAEELTQGGTAVFNYGAEIYVVKPIANVNGQWIFQDSMIDKITNRNVVLVVPTISSGRTVRSLLECIQYYQGNLVGISVLFLISESGLKEELEKYIHPVFTTEDIPDFMIYSVDKCEMCKEGVKLDALINSEGYKLLSDMGRR